MEYIVKEALLSGFTNAKYVDNLKVECEDRIRAFCNPLYCWNMTKNWICPPACGTVQECYQNIKHFEKGVILVSMTDLTPPVEMDYYKQLNVEHNLRLKSLLEKLEDKYELFPLTSGGCIFCEKCTYPNPCIKPQLKMNSLSAYGIDVTKLCHNEGIEFSFRPDRVYYIALLLVA